MELSEVVANRRWAVYDEPFKHVVAENVFTEDFYRSLTSEVGAIVSKGCFDGGVLFERMLSRSMSKYDCYGLRLDDKNVSPNDAMHVFMTPEWSRMVGDVFGVDPTGYVSVAIHHHDVGSDNGWIHNDFNPAWFRIKEEGKIRHPVPECSYFSGDGSLRPDEKVETVRAVALIYYLCNDGWQPGMGGETGLYASKSDLEPAVLVPPINNSMVMYECTPKSWHTFLNNRVQTRTSIIMWIHRTMEDALAHVGTSEELVRWKKANASAF
jgi:2-oxoglutarate-Fe(II)-dependent oxygenase superfamily protein